MPWSYTANERKSRFIARKARDGAEGFPSLRMTGGKGGCDRLRYRRPIAMRRVFVSAALLLVASFSVAGSTEGLRCSLTGKTMESCCCQQKDGKLYCPLAKKTIEQCCCESSKQAR